MTQEGLTIASGAFPDGSQSWSVDTLRDTWVLPDWSIVDSPGVLYTRWGSGGRAGMELSPSVRAGASISDSRTYASGSEISVRIWRTWNEYRDVTELLDADAGMPVVKKAENLPGSISLAIDMDWETPSANPLSSSFGGWNRLVSGIGTSAAGAIRTGMYLTVHVKESGKWAPKAEGWISTLSPDAGRLRIECADGLAVLAHQGATLRRNYYSAHIRAKGDGSLVDGSLTGSLSAMPSGAVVDPNSFLWLVIKRWPGSSRISGNSYERGTTALSTASSWMPYIRLKFRSPITCRLEHVTTHVANQELNAQANCRIEATVGNVRFRSGIRLLGAFQTTELEFTWPMSDSPVISEGQEVTLTWYAQPVAPASQTQTLHLHFWFGDNDGADIECQMEARVENGSAVGTHLAPDWAIYAYEYMPATGTVSGSYVTDITVEGYQGDEEDLVDPPDDRFEYSYYTAEQDRDEVIPNLVMGHGSLPFVAGSTDAVLGVYRIGGGFMADYLTRISDVAGDDGKRRTWTARGFSVMAIASGVSHERTDAAMLTVCRNAGASGVPSGAVEFVSFSPKMTLKGKPSLAVVRGTWEGDESIPMVVAVEAEGVSEARGLVIEAVATDSDASDVKSAMRAAWASLDAGSLDVWEGTLTIPGFRPDLIERTGANAGAGAVVAIYDERYGLSGYPVLVKEVKADYGSWTTEVTVTSNSAVYASTVPETAAAVQMAGDLSTGSGLLYQTQYARIVTQTAVAIPPTVEVATEDGEWWECEDVSVGYTPTRAVVTARIKGVRGRCTDYDGRYAVAQVRLDGGTALDIDPYRRPDLYEGQTLIVQVDAPRPS
jgi:hypothetical protein